MQAPQSSKLWRVGYMANGSQGPDFDGLRKGFAGLGYAEGQNIIFEGRFAEHQLDQHLAFAADLVRLDVDLILTFGGPATTAAKKATAKIPIVFLLVADPVAIGVAATMERPGSNATGITNHDPQQARKQFELLKEVFPELTRVAILSDADIPGANATGLAPIERANDAAARALGIHPQVFKVNGPKPDLEGAFAAMERERAQALLVLEVPVPIAHRERVAELAAARRLPTIFPGSLGDAGGLITCGTSVFDGLPRLPMIAEKVLRGAKPADLPIEVISRRVLAINMKTARQIGVTIPPDVIKRADTIID
jgi:putative tryptophan/tyrosine transport system substrate-binding protein